MYAVCRVRVFAWEKGPWLSPDFRRIPDVNKVERSCPIGWLQDLAQVFPAFPSLHRGRHYWVPTTKRLFGGQIVGQALVAAAKSVSEDFHVHSLHCYFVRTGKLSPLYTQTQP